MIHTAVGASFRMETAAASARLGSYLFAGFQQSNRYMIAYLNFMAKVDLPNH